MNYQEYILSEAWAKKRQFALLKAKNKCQLCSFEHELDVHHLSYKNLGNEKDKDLLVLCRRCHRDLHFFMELQPITTRQLLQITPVTEEDYRRKATE